MLTNSLPIRELLLKRHVLNSKEVAVCVLCREEIESLKHLFIHCNVVKGVWLHIGKWLDVQLPNLVHIMQHFIYFGELCKGKKATKVR